MLMFMNGRSYYPRRTMIYLPVYMNIRYVKWRFF